MGKKRNPCLTTRNGRLVGREPAALSAFDLFDVGIRQEAPETAIGKMCRQCAAGDGNKVADCTDTGCPLWVFRMGNPWEHILRRYGRDCIDRQREEWRRGAS